MRLKRQVVMLPTNEKANGRIVIDSFRTIKPNMFIIHDNLYQHEDYKPQHLYILSDEKIEAGDWCVEFVNNIPTNILQVKGNDFERCLHNYEKLKKIIATTDSSIACVKDTLSIPQRRGLINHYPTEKWILPQPSQSFIEKYVEEYNKGNIITEVMVEYESYHGINTSIAEINAISGDNSMNWQGIGDNRDFKLKINPKDNTITIRKVKDSWSREEIIQLIDSLYEQGGFDDYLNELLDKNNVIKKVSFSKSDAGKKWIEQNL